MNQSPQPPTLNPGAFRLILWVIWASFLGSLFVYKIVFTFGIETDWSTFGVLPLGILVISAAASLGMRLLLLPKFKEPGKLLPIFVVGLALAEVPAFFGFFVFPAVSIAFFVISVGLVLTFLPIFEIQFPND